MARDLPTDPPPGRRRPSRRLVVAFALAVPAIVVIVYFGQNPNRTATAIFAAIAVVVFIFVMFDAYILTPLHVFAFIARRIESVVQRRADEKGDGTNRGSR